MIADLRYQAFNSEVSFRNDFNKVFKTVLNTWLIISFTSGWLNKTFYESPH